ncbi:hypothetical protein BKA62DRAFT_693494 [Auriculariales sp. MPI-PUGE-AT-0066]|nr:hypothetical protein BKA62DRAFT_693494 [Auriculariales sp. MPI-PUGE-AT-0066]
MTVLSRTTLFAALALAQAHAVSASCRHDIYGNYYCDSGLSTAARAAVAIICSVIFFAIIAGLLAHRRRQANRTNMAYVVTTTGAPGQPGYPQQHGYPQQPGYGPSPYAAPGTGYPMYPVGSPYATAKGPEPGGYDVAPTQYPQAAYAGAQGTYPGGGYSTYGPPAGPPPTSSDSPPAPAYSGYSAPQGPPPPVVAPRPGEKS